MNYNRYMGLGQMGMSGQKDLRGTVEGNAGSMTYKEPKVENRTVSLQPMFVTSRTTLTEIDEHLNSAETRIVVVTMEAGNSKGEMFVDHIGDRYKDVRMVLVCEGSVQEVLYQSFKSGVWACVSRQSSVETLRSAIDSVASGVRYLAPELAQQHTAQTARPVFGSERDTVKIHSSEEDSQLTRRERQVLGLIAQGRPRRDIAELLKVSPRTIDAYRARLLQKLNLESSVQLVKYALARGMGH